LFVVLVLFCQAPSDAHSGTLSKAEVDALWERLLLEERYEAIQYFYRSSVPSVYRSPDQVLLVQETREGLLWGFFGELGTGGGWEVSGRLEAEMSSPPSGVLQLYSKAASQWSPGFAFAWMPGYDPKKYPTWEFRLVVRNPNDRRQVRKIKSIEFGPGDVVPTENADGTSIKALIGQRVPRGELAYDQARGLAIVRILGLRAPITLEVSVDGR
jgi:hypothetical protein